MAGRDRISGRSDEILRNVRVAALVDNYFEQVELTGPREAFEAAGAEVDIVARQLNVTGMNHIEPGDDFTADRLLEDAQADDYDALLLPGGVVNGDSLRIVPEAQRLVKAFAEQEKPVAVICHGGWILISCGLARGRTLTSWPTLRDDYTNAGAQWKDQEVIVDGNWISSRKPDDIPAFTRAAIDVFARAKGEQRKAA